MIVRVLRAALLGAATIFAPKFAGQHWATPPTATIVVEDHADANADRHTAPAD